MLSECELKIGAAHVVVGASLLQSDFFLRPAPYDIEPSANQHFILGVADKTCGAKTAAETIHEITRNKFAAGPSLVLLPQAVLTQAPLAPVPIFA
jgi:hypothetical protein